MTKCQPRTLTPYIDGELRDDVQGQVEEHLRSCPSCSAIIDELTVAARRVQGLGRSTIPLAQLQPSVAAFAERARLEPGDIYGEDRPTRSRHKPSTSVAVVAAPDEPNAEAEAPPALEPVPTPEPVVEQLEAAPPAPPRSRKRQTEKFFAPAPDPALEGLPPAFWGGDEHTDPDTLLAEGREAVDQALAADTSEAPEAEPEAAAAPDEDAPVKAPAPGPSAIEPWRQAWNAEPDAGGDAATPGKDDTPATAAFWAALNEIGREQDSALLVGKAGPLVDDGPEAAVANMRAALRERSLLRPSLLSRARAPVSGRLQLALTIAVGLVIILGSGAILVYALRQPQPQAAARPAVQQTPRAQASANPTPSAVAQPSPAPALAAPALTNVLTAGAGGTPGFRVNGIGLAPRGRRDPGWCWT